MIISSNLGFPRIGHQRDLKIALEQYWKAEISADQLMEKAAKLRERHWKLQMSAGITHIPSNDFSLYDQVLDCALMVGAIPSRYQNDDLLQAYFGMARGNRENVALEMTKWFDTNYHYIVPELSAETVFKLTSLKPLEEFNQAKSLGILTRPVLIGPLSFLLLSKMRDHSNRLALLPQLLSVYREMISKLKEAGAEWIQIDEPYLVCDLDEQTKDAYKQAYASLTKDSGINYLLTTYFGALSDNLELAAHLPVEGLHVDLVRAPEQLAIVCETLPKNKWLSLGLIDGRNIWKNDLGASEEIMKEALEKHGEKLMIGPSCSLLHAPVDLNTETKLDAELLNWLAFATQKLSEIHLLAQSANGRRDDQAFKTNAMMMKERLSSQRIHNLEVKRALAAVTPDMMKRKLPFQARIRLQQDALHLPLLPTTTIGSFPQTKEVREMRSRFKKGELTEQQYEQFLEDNIRTAMHWQDEIGIDVPVHGEFERNDMVEYFGEQLQGFAFTEYGWVQSYGSRCVKPPIIYGDISRPHPMTVRFSAYAQKQTKKPVKGMLTGPVTILQWSFVRNDQPRATTCRQIALAIRDEVQDLEAAGIQIIQIDEPALREGLPLRRADWKSYLKWAIESFQLSSCGVKNETQIHTHMCYCEFNDIIEDIAALDADVISIETSRSAMELLDAFVQYKYPNDIGPGVYDIHSPRVPNQAEMEQLLNKALQVLTKQQLWVNPDCGLKTRSWAEVKPALEAMVCAAKALREKYQESETHRRSA